VPAVHSPRLAWVLVDGIHKSMDAEFDQLYSDIGRHSIPPERLFRWFVGLVMDAAVWDHPTFTRDRLLTVYGQEMSNCGWKRHTQASPRVFQRNRKILRNNHKMRLSSICGVAIRMDPQKGYIHYISTAYRHECKTIFIAYIIDL